MRLAPVMLALLLALSPGAVAMQASAPTPASADRTDAVSPTVTQNTDAVSPSVTENTTAVLTLGTEPDRAVFDSPSMSLASAVETDRDGFQSELDTKALDTQLRNADSEEAKKRILNRYQFRIENQIISLESEERRATGSFSNGTISAREYVRTLARLTVKASELRTDIETLDSRMQEVPNFGATDMERRLKGKLATYEGPVRDRIAKSMEGRADPVRIHVTTAETGVVLAMVTDDHYVREVHLPDNRDPSASVRLSREEGENSVIQPQYPWVINNSPSARWTSYGSLQMMQYTYQHPHGNLTTYVDSGTEKIFYEVQYKHLSGQQSLPPGPGVQNTTEAAFGAENVTLTVNRSYAGGPLRVQLANATGEPLDGSITVDGEPVGDTGDDGVLWTLSPDETFRVGGTYDETNINVTTDPVSLERSPSED